MEKIFKALINSNIYISLAAVIFTIETQIQLGMIPHWHPYLFLIFFATLFEYNLHRLVTVLAHKNALNDEKHKWVKKYPTFFFLLIAFSVIGFLVSVFLARKEVLLVLSPLAFITISYSLPVFRKTGYLLRLREIPFLKIFLISLVWSMVTILLPIIQSDRPYDKENIVLMLVERFVFVFAITIPFDIRDLKVDLQAGLKTLPILIGPQNALVMSNILIVVFLGLCLFHYIELKHYIILSALVFSSVCTLFFVNSKKLLKLHFYYYGILDGTMLLQGFLVFFSYIIFSNIK